jgi:hypothetical protein
MSAAEGLSSLGLKHLADPVIWLVTKSGLSMVLLPGYIHFSLGMEASSWAFVRM